MIVLFAVGRGVEGRLDARDVADVEPEEQAADRREQPDAHGRRQANAAALAARGQELLVVARFGRPHVRTRSPSTTCGARPRQKRHVGAYGKMGYQANILAGWTGDDQ